MKDEELHRFRQLMDGVFARRREAEERARADGSRIEETEWGYFNRMGTRSMPPEEVVIRRIELTPKTETPMSRRRDWRKTAGVPWRLWAVLVAIAALACVLSMADPPPFTYTAPRLELFTDHATAEFEVTNHSFQPLDRKLSVSIRGGRRAGSVMGEQELSVSLAGKEAKHLHCDFSLTRGLPSMAEVIVR